MDRNFHEKLTEVQTHGDTRFQQQEYGTGHRQRSKGAWSSPWRVVILIAVPVILYLLYRLLERAV